MSDVASAIEDRTRAYGRDIFARLDRRGPIPLRRRGLDDRLMQLTMGMKRSRSNCSGSSTLCRT